MTDPTWLTRLERRVRHWRDRGLGPTWVVAVSGGGDSVALLLALHGLAPQFGLNLAVAHLDHGARGEAGRQDAAFVADLAERLGLPFDHGTWRPTRAAHFEADARRARHAFLVDTALERHAAAVALAHTRDDQAETVLHRVVRGTGLRGLAGIPAARRLRSGPTLVRPLLHATRAELRAYLDSLGQPFRDDPTNADTTRTRARIRHEALPALAAGFNPRAADALANLARLATAAERSVARRLRAAERAAVVETGPDRVVVDPVALAALTPFERAELLRRVWRRAGWPERGMTAGRWRRLAALARRDPPDGPHDVGAGVVARRDPVGFVLHKPAPMGNTPPPAPGVVPLDLPGQADWPGGRVRAALEPPPGGTFERVDLDRLAPPLCVRPPRPGDRFDPLGGPAAAVRLAPFLRARGVPAADRGSVPLVCDAAGVVWVVGHRIADRVKQTDATTRTAWLSWEPSDRDEP